MRRTFSPARSPKAIRCLTEAAIGARELRFVVEQRIIPGGHGNIHACFRIAQPAQLADHPVTDLLEDRGKVDIAGRFRFEKAGSEVRAAAIEVDALKEDDVKMEIQIETSAGSLDK